MDEEKNAVNQAVPMVLQKAGHFSRFAATEKGLAESERGEQAAYLFNYYSAHK
jgi:hypothetical protein